MPDASREEELRDTSTEALVDVSDVAVTALPNRVSYARTLPRRDVTRLDAEVLRTRSGHP
jgi:hypothetical protein